MCVKIPYYDHGFMKEFTIAMSINEPCVVKNVQNIDCHPQSSRRRYCFSSRCSTDMSNPKL